MRDPIDPRRLQREVGRLLAELARLTLAVEPHQVAAAWEALDLLREAEATFAEATTQEDQR